VSGASDTISALPGDPVNGRLSSAGLQRTPVVKNSNGGKLTLQGEQILFTAATLLGNPGSSPDAAPARGGRPHHRLQSGHYQIGSKLLAQTDTALIVTSATPGFQYNGLGQAVTDSKNQKADRRCDKRPWDALVRSG